jgi:predicted ATP-binding protein involved in virulence
LVDQLSHGKKGKMTSAKLQTELRELENKRESLMSAGLMEPDETNVQVPDQAVVDDLTRTVLSIYIKDVEKKLKVFDDILEKIQLLQKIINARFLYKKMNISKREGYLFVTPDGAPLAPDSLSSGEQHELVLFYELLFRIQPGSLILIDEPELSLHIEWQQQFLKDLAAITQIANFDVVIATHSADIIFDRWDLTVDLKGPEES